MDCHRKGCPHKWSFQHVLSPQKNTKSNCSSKAAEVESFVARDGKIGEATKNDLVIRHLVLKRNGVLVLQEHSNEGSG